MLRVGDLQRSIDFYTNVLGTALLRTSERGVQVLLAFVGYGEESETAVIELTYNWGVDSYELGTAYGHIALSVDNAAEACERIRQNRASITREAGPVKAAPPSSPSWKIGRLQNPSSCEEKDAAQRSGQLTLPHAGIFNAMARPALRRPLFSLHPCLLQAAAKFAMMPRYFFQLRESDVRGAAQLNGLCDRFRGFYPVVIDVGNRRISAPKPTPCWRSPPLR